MFRKKESFTLKAHNDEDPSQKVKHLSVKSDLWMVSVDAAGVKTACIFDPPQKVVVLKKKWGGTFLHGGGLYLIFHPNWSKLGTSLPLAPNIVIIFKNLKLI